MNVAKNLGVDAGSSAGEWLFRQGELILGPVPAVNIVERLYSGELDGKTEVSLLGNSVFTRLSEVDVFKVHLAKAEAKLRVDAAARQERARTQKQRAARVALVGVVALGVAVGAAMVARYLAVHASLASDGEAMFEIEAPIIRLARASSVDDELLDYPGPGTPKPAPEPPSLGAVAPPTTPAPPPGALGAPLKSARVEKPARRAAVDKRNPGKAPATSNEPDGMQTSDFDQDAINAVVAQKQKTLYPCLKQEVERRPALSGRIPIEFVIGNDGKVAKLWIDHPELKNGPMYDCMLKELQRWPFKPYEGEQATVSLSFKINPRK